MMYEAARTLRLQGKGLKEAMHGRLGAIPLGTGRFADGPVRTDGGLVFGDEHYATLEGRHSENFIIWRS